MPALLVISPSTETHVFLHAVLDRTHWKMLGARTYREAVIALCHERPSIIICDSSLPDGSWKDVLGLVAPLPESPLLVVTAASADARLWAEALNLGAYDVLTRPLDEREVTHVLSGAGRRVESRRPETAGRSRAAAAA